MVLKPTLSQLGFQFLPLRDQALAATDAPVDFGQLFVYFSFFLVVAAAVLTGLLLSFPEHAHREAGLLLALGLRPRQVRRLFLAEGTALAIVGSVLGLFGAVFIRSSSCARSPQFGAVRSVACISSSAPELMTLATGVASGIFVAFVAMWLASRRQLKHSARELLAASGAIEMARADRPAGAPEPGYRCGRAARRRSGAWPSINPLVRRIPSSAPSLLLIAGLAFGSAWLRQSAE